MLTESRKRILQWVYDKSVEKPGAPLFFSQDIMASLELEEDQYTFDVRFLIGKGWLEVGSRAQTGRPWPMGVKITTKGIELVESNFGEQEPPEEKPPLGFIKEE